MHYATYLFLMYLLTAAIVGIPVPRENIKKTKMSDSGEKINYVRSLPKQTQKATTTRDVDTTRKVITDQLRVNDEEVPRSSLSPFIPSILSSENHMSTVDSRDSTNSMNSEDSVPSVTTSSTNTGDVFSKSKVTVSVSIGSLRDVTTSEEAGKVNYYGNALKTLRNSPLHADQVRETAEGSPMDKSKPHQEQRIETKEILHQEIVMLDSVSKAVNNFTDHKFPNVAQLYNTLPCTRQIKPSETVDLTQLTNTMSGLWTAVTAVCLLENALDIDAEVGEVCNATGPVATRLDTFTRGLERNVVRRMDHNYQSPGPLVVPDNVHGTYLIRCVQEMLRNTWQVLSNLNSQQSPSSHGN